MKIDLSYNVFVTTMPLDDFSYDDTCIYTIDVDLQEILEYLYYKRYNKFYNPLSWYLEDNAKEFVKSIEDDWFHNRLNDIELSQNKDFISYLKHKYRVDALDKYEKSVNLNSIESEMMDYIDDNFDVDIDVEVID